MRDGWSEEKMRAGHPLIYDEISFYIVYIIEVILRTEVI